MIFDHCSKQYYWSVKWHSEPPFIGLSSRQTRDLECFADSSNIQWNPPTIFHPDLIATVLQCSFLYSAHCSLSNPISFRSVRCQRTVIPEKVFTGFAKFKGTVSVNDFWFPGRLQELLHALWCFLRRFSFYVGRIVSAVLPSLVPPPRIDDCVEIHSLH